MLARCYYVGDMPSVNNTHNMFDCVHILYGVPHESILGPLLLNIILCDLFIILENSYFTSYAEEASPFAVRRSTEKVLDELLVGK